MPIIHCSLPYMLLEITIQNFALISTLRLEFKPGFTILTGETGAGKSIIIDALSLLLGERASADQIRKGFSSASVEGVFDRPSAPELRSILEESGIDTEEDTLIIKREIQENGRSRAFVNGSGVTLNILQKIGNFLVDLHGQHAHQSLFNIDSHLEILDQFGLIDVAAITNFYHRLVRLQQEITQRKKQQTDLQDKLELYQFQYKEIEAANPQPGEDEALEAELKVLDNAEKLLAFAHLGSQTLRGEDEAILSRLKIISRQGDALKAIDPRLNEILQRLASTAIELDDIESELSRYAVTVQYDPGRAEFLRERLDDLNRLMRKYGGNLSSVLTKKQFLQKQLSNLEYSDQELASLEIGLANARQQFAEQCVALSVRRQDAAAKLNQRIEAQLQELGMERTRFITQMNRENDPQGLAQLNGDCYKATAKGIDLIEFLVAPNVGEDPKPLVKIASGGEISRLMLAVKSVLAEADAIPTLIFDEVDVGIGGRIAEKVGQKMAEIASRRQVICITHLPIIAALGDQHIIVSKAEEDSRTVTRVRPLTLPEREEELARMLGGDTITHTTRTHARELLQKTAAANHGY